MSSIKKRKMPYEKKLQKFGINMGQRYKIFRKKEKSVGPYYNEIREKI